jgi:hypothetical protein
MIPTGPHGSHVGPDGVERLAYGQRIRFGIQLGGSFIFGEPSRGFIGQIECTAADWLAHGDSILAAHPVVSVTLTTRPGHTVLNPLEDGRQHVAVDLGPKGCLGGIAATVNDAIIGALGAGDAWPSVRTWHLPPEPVALRAHRLTMLAPVPEELIGSGLRGL